MQRGKKILVVITAAAFLAAGCSGREIKSILGDSSLEQAVEPEDTEVSRDVFAMDTYMEVKAFGPDAEEAVGQAINEIQRLDALLSAESESSEVSAINNRTVTELSDDTAYLLERSLELYDSTDGCFDLAIYPVMEAWGFPTQEFQVPGEDVLQELLRHIDASQISYDEVSHEISFADGDED